MMDVFADISAVQNRIAEITGAPAPGSTLPAPVAVSASVGAPRFATALANALKPANPALGLQPGGADAPGSGAPAPVPPAQIDALVQQNASTWQVDPALLKAVIANESGFNANATSPVGAQGLMHLCPPPFIVEDDPARFAARAAYLLRVPSERAVLEHRARSCAQRFTPMAAFAEFRAATSAVEAA